jgi:hypothetical protein
MKEVQFKNGEKRTVTDRAALLFEEKGLLKKEEKTKPETKEEKLTPKTKKK